MQLKHDARELSCGKEEPQGPQWLSACLSWDRTVEFSVVQHNATMNTHNSICYHIARISGA